MNKEQIERKLDRCIADRDKLDSDYNTKSEALTNKFEELMEKYKQ